MSGTLNPGRTPFVNFITTNIGTTLICAADLTYAPDIGIIRRINAAQHFETF